MIRSSVVVAGLLIWGGCASTEESLEERFYACRDLTSDKTTRAESLDCWTPHSRTLVEELTEQRRTSGKVLNYLGNYRKLLDYDDALAPAEVIGDLALLPVGSGRKTETIVFERGEDGVWRIDITELRRFWKPLVDAMRIE